jgi:hypothetical protein
MCPVPQSLVDRGVLYEKGLGFGLLAWTTHPDNHKNQLGLADGGSQPSQTSTRRGPRPGKLPKTLTFNGTFDFYFVLAMNDRRAIPLCWRLRQWI